MKLHPTPLRAGLWPDGEQLADVRLGPRPCPRAGGSASCVPAQDGVGRVPEGRGFAGYFTELRGTWGGEGRSG